MDFHGQGETMIISENFPTEVKDNQVIVLSHPSIFKKIIDNMFIGLIKSCILTTPFDMFVPETDNVYFMMAYIDDEGKYYNTTKENVAKIAQNEITEFINEFDKKLYKFKHNDDYIYFIDYTDINIENHMSKMKKYWNLGFPVVVFNENSSEKPKTYFPLKVNDKPNIFLILLSNISNMDFEKIDAMIIENVEDILSNNGLMHYNNLKTLAQLLKTKPLFLNRKFNGVYIQDKANLRKLLLNPPPRNGNNLSKWSALKNIVRMIKEHENM